MSEHTDQKGNPLRVDDPVSWTTVKQTARGYRFTSHEGKVKSFDQCGGFHSAVVRMKNGQDTHIEVNKLRRADLTKNELTEAITGSANTGAMP